MGSCPGWGPRTLPGKASLTEGPSPAVVCGEGAKADPDGRCWGGGKRRGAGRGSAWHGGQGTVGCSGDDPGSCQGRDPHGVRPHSTEQVCLAWGDARGGNPGGAGPGLQDLPAPYMASVGAAGGGPPLPPRRRWCSSRVSPETSSPRTHPAHRSPGPLAFLLPCKGRCSLRPRGLCPRRPLCREHCPLSGAPSPLSGAPSPVGSAVVPAPVWPGPWRRSVSAQTAAPPQPLTRHSQAPARLSPSSCFLPRRHELAFGLFPVSVR